MGRRSLSSAAQQSWPPSRPLIRSATLEVRAWRPGLFSKRIFAIVGERRCERVMHKCGGEGRGGGGWTLAPARWIMLAPALSVLALCLFTATSPENKTQRRLFQQRIESNPVDLARSIKPVSSVLWSQVDRCAALLSPRWPLRCLAGKTARTKGTGGWKDGRMDHVRGEEEEEEGATDVRQGLHRPREAGHLETSPSETPPTPQNPRRVSRIAMSTAGLLLLPRKPGQSRH